MHVSDNSVSLDSRYVIGTYARLPQEFVSGSGAILSDEVGAEYIDMLSGIGCASLGHANPELAKALTEQASRLWQVSNYYHDENRAEMAKSLSKMLSATTDEEGGKIGTATPQMMVDRGYVPRKMILVGDTAGEEPGQLFVAEKGHARIRLVAHGKGGHSSRPWALDNPIPKLCAAYLKFKESWDPDADPNEHWRTVLSPTILKGSAAGNVVPDAAVMQLSCRFTTMEDYERICDCARRTSGCEVVAPKVPHRLPVLNREGDPEIAALFASLSAEFPGFRLGRMSAATDATYYVHLGIPIVIFAAESYGAHAQDERGSISSLHRYADVLTRHLKAHASRR